jgi:streptogramin lyase
MDKKRLYRFTFYVLLSFLFTGCASLNTYPVGPCIKPKFKLAYPANATALPGSYPVKKILPEGNWHIEAELPVSTNDSIHTLINRNNDEIWMIDSQSVFRYNTDTHQWRSYSAIESVQAYPERLLLAPDGVVWGVGFLYSSLNLPSERFPFLSRYNDLTDQFEFVKDQEGIIQSLESHRSPPNAQFDSSGILWMIVGTDTMGLDGLYSFNPITNKLTKHLPGIGLSGRASLAVAPDQKIWILDPYLDESLIEYDPFTGQYNNTFVNDLIWDVHNWSGVLFFDRSGKLWAGIDGWFDFSGSDSPSWNRIIPSPVFISDYYDGENQFVMTRPSAIYQSSNGWYWFNFPDNGIVQLDNEMNKWCRFTTETSPIVEDKQQNLRIVIDGKIYVLNLRPY